MVDKGKELLADLKSMMAGILCSPISNRNSQANVIVEKVHHTSGIIIGAFKISTNGFR